MSGFALGALLMVLSGSLNAVMNAVIKGGRDKAAGRAVADATSALIALPAVFLLPEPGAAWPFVLASAALHGVYLYALVSAFNGGDFSASYPVVRGTAPLVTGLITVGLLGEAASVGQVVGVAVIGTAMFVMVTGRHLDLPTLGWSLLAGVAGAVCVVVDARGVRAAPTEFSYIAWLFVLVGVVVVSMFAVTSRGAIFASASRQWRPAAAAGVLSVAGYGMALYALSRGPTAPLAALRETGMVTALVVSVVFLGERATVGRVAGVMGIVLGAALIITG